jgi:tetratricopeptide (TPR) repeat protein
MREAMRDRAQSLIFREREDDALALLQQLEALDPDFRDLDRLRRHAHHKQAKHLVVEGDGLLSQREFQAAMEKYLESQRIVPGFKLAENGMERVKDELARMDSVAQKQFLQAVRKYPEFRHIEVSWHAEAVLRNTPDPADERRVNAQKLRDDARSERARAKYAEAMECERLDKFGAALVLYRQARKLDAEVEGVQESIDRMNAELAALGLIESAQLIMRNGEFAEAKELLELAFEKSELSRGAISELMIQNRRLQAEADYRAARDFEVMGKKAEALAAFEALAAKWPDGFEDEAARIDALRVDIQGAREEWQAALDAENAGDLEKALDHFVNAERFYEQWRDGEAQIERLRAAIAARAAEAGGGEGQS